MAKAEGIPPTASTASVGPGINYAGSWVYAYSGVITSTSSVANLLEFTTGSGLIDATVLFHLSSIPSSAVSFTFDIEMNDEVIVRELLYDPHSGRQPTDSDNMYIIIPPFTKCKFAATATSGDEDFCVTLRGRVYGAA